MSSAIILLDKYRETCSPASDTEVARRLKVRASAVSNWRHETAKPNAAAIERMCAAINEPLAKWLPLIEAERARTPEDKKVWLRLAQAAAGLLLGVGIAPNSHAAMTSTGYSAQEVATVYIMRNYRSAAPAGWHGPCVAGRPFTARIARMFSALEYGQGT